MANADPVAGDTTVSGYTTDWTFGINPLASGSYWRCMVFGTTPDDTPPGTQGHWNRKMRPMRFEVVSEGSLFAVYRSISELASPSFGGGARLTEPIFYPPPASGVGPPLSGHFVGSETSTFSISVPFSTPIIRSATARYMRLLVDGVDVSGAVAISVAGTSQQLSNAYYNFPASGITVTPVDVTSKTIEVDIWMEVDVTVPGGVLVSDGYSFYPALWAWQGSRGGRFANSVPHYLHFIRGINGLEVNALLATSREYEFTFSSAIRGQTSATTVTAPPWSVTRTTKAVTLTHSSGFDKIILHYGQEIVEILVRLDQTHVPFQNLVWYYRYVPQSTGDYALDDLVQPGIFTPDTLQTFALVGAANSQDDATRYATSAATLASLVSDGWCPATIDVGPIP